MELVIILVGVVIVAYFGYQAFAKKADSNKDGHVSQAEAKAVVEEAKVEVKKVATKAKAAAKTTATRAKTAVKKATTTAKK
jgi:arginine exporter protein ArgO